MIPGERQAAGTEFPPQTWKRRRKDRQHLDTSCLPCKPAPPAKTECRVCINRLPCLQVALGISQWEVLAGGWCEGRERSGNIQSSRSPPMGSLLAGCFPHLAMVTSPVKVAPFAQAPLGFQELLLFLPLPSPLLPRPGDPLFPGVPYIPPMSL